MEHLRICIELVNKAIEGRDNDESRQFATIARGLLDRALHSCQYWWASCRPWWDTGMIEAGAQRFYDAIHKIRRNLTSGELEEVKTVFESIVKTARQWQETGKADSLKQQYLEGHKEVTSELTFGQH